MSCLGVHYALTEKDANHLRSLPSEEARLEYVQEVIEEDYFESQPEWKAETDKSWDALHRLLTDGELSYEGGEYPLNHTVLAGELLYTQPDYIMSLKTPQQVRDVASALSRLSEDEFRRRYFAIDADSYGFAVSDEDFSYTWHWFHGVRDLYGNAATDGRYILFTADQ
jgi:hypothetical protein